MIIYADITIFNNFLMTLAIIWAVASILELKYCWWRLILSAIVGTVYFIIVIFIQFHYSTSGFNIIIHIGLNIITALLMIRIVFGKLARKQYIKTVIYLYLVTFITIGTTLSLFYIFGGSPFKPGIQRLLTGVFVLLILGNLGWRLFQQYNTPAEFYLPVKVFLGEKTVKFTGLIDTGNNLNDPLTRAPVIVINKDAIISLFPEEIQQLVIDNNDLLQLVEIINKSKIASRIRVLPFSDLGQEHGMLIGVRPDLVKLEYQNQILKIRKCILALSERPLDDNNKYQALIHPGLMKIDV